MSKPNEKYQKRDPKILWVKYKDGTIICCPKASDTFKVVLEKSNIDMAKVLDLFKEEKGIPFVSKEYSSDEHVRAHQKEIRGYYFYVKISTYILFYYLYKIWKEFKINFIQDIDCVKK